MSPSIRALLGFVAGAIAVLTFHQGLIAILHVLALPGLEVRGLPYNTMPVPPFGIPTFANLAFWGGVYGTVFGVLAPALNGPKWFYGIIMGIIAALVGMFIVSPLKGGAIAGGWVLANWVRSFLINGFWGLGLGLIYPPLARRRARSIA
jgi:hypothetical protein